MATVSEVNVGLRAYAHLPAGRMLGVEVSHSSFAELVVGIQGIIPEGRSLVLSFHDENAATTFQVVDQSAYNLKDFSKSKGFFVAGFSERVIISQVIAYVFDGDSKLGTFLRSESVLHGDFDELNDGVNARFGRVGASINMTQVDNILITGVPSTHIRCDFNDLQQLIPVERLSGASDDHTNANASATVITTIDTNSCWIDSIGMYGRINALLPVVCLIRISDSNKKGSLFSILCDLNLRLSTLISTQ